MKKFALSLVVVAASGAYVWNQWGSGQEETLLGLSPASAEASIGETPDTPAIELSPPPQPAAPSNGPKAAPAAVILKAPFIIDKPVTPVPPIVADAVAAPLPVVAAEVAVPPAPDTERQAIAAVAAPVTAPLPPRPRPRPHLVRNTMPLATQVSMTVAAAGAYADGTFTGPPVDAYYGIVQIQAVVQRGKLAGIKVLQYPSDRRTSVAINRQALPMLRDEAVQAQSANVDIVSGATLTSQAFARSLKGALMQATA